MKTHFPSLEASQISCRFVMRLLQMSLYFLNKAWEGCGCFFFFFLSPSCHLKSLSAEMQLCKANLVKFFHSGERRLEASLFFYAFKTAQISAQRGIFLFLFFFYKIHNPEKISSAQTIFIKEAFILLLSPNPPPPTEYRGSPQCTSTIKPRTSVAK